MKQKDIIILIVALFVSMLASILVSKFVFSTPKNLDQQVDIVPSISTKFVTPSSTYFNSQALDPTQLINIAPSNNSQPFNGTSN